MRGRYSLQFTVMVTSEHFAAFYGTTSWISRSNPLRGGHGKGLRSENSAILIFDETMTLGFCVLKDEGRRLRSPQTLYLGLPCPIRFPVLAENPVWIKIMSQATYGEAARHARVSEDHTLDIQSGDGYLRGIDGVKTALYCNA